MAVAQATEAEKIEDDRHEPVGRVLPHIGDLERQPESDEKALDEQAIPVKRETISESRRPSQRSD
jgi:hypothetical protein